MIIDFANNPQLYVYGVLEAGGYQQIAIAGSCPQFAHCALRNSSLMGVNTWSTSGTVTFAHCSITECTSGMQVHNEASVTMTACHIGANDEGGIEVLANCTLTMIDCSIVGHHSSYGGSGGITFETGTLVMEGCELSANWANGYYAGAALSVANGSSATLDRCTIDGTEGETAVYINGYSPSATITNSIITNNNVATGIISCRMPIAFIHFHERGHAGGLHPRV